LLKLRDLLMNKHTKLGLTWIGKENWRGEPVGRGVILRVGSYRRLMECKMSRTLTLELPPDLERDLAREAERLNLTVEEYALRLLLEAQSGAPPRNGAELVAYSEREG
jgi:hypothetical protein